MLRFNLWICVLAGVMALGVRRADGQEVEFARLVAAMPEGVESVYVRDYDKMRVGEWKSVVPVDEAQGAGPVTDLVSLVWSVVWKSNVHYFALGGSAFEMPDGIGGSTLTAREMFITGADLKGLRRVLEDPSTKHVLERVDRDGLRFFRGGPNSRWGGPEKEDGPARARESFVCLPDDHSVIIAPTIEECTSMARAIANPEPMAKIGEQLTKRWGDAAIAIWDESPWIIVRAIDPGPKSNFLHRGTANAHNLVGQWPPRDVMVVRAVKGPKIEAQVFGFDLDLPSNWLSTCLGQSRCQEMSKRGLLITADPLAGYGRDNPEAAASLYLRPLMAFGFGVAI